MSHRIHTRRLNIRSFAGSQELQGLERALNLQRLAKVSADVLKAPFLVLLRTTIAVGYSTSVSHSDERLESPCITGNAFSEAQKNLLRNLAHHMIHIAGRAQVLDSQRDNCHTLDHAYCLWSRKAVFEWEIVPNDSPRELEEELRPFAHFCSAHNTRTRLHGSEWGAITATFSKNFGSLFDLTLRHRFSRECFSKTSTPSHQRHRKFNAWPMFLLQQRT